jgi:hypothetical protein
MNIEEAGDGVPPLNWRKSSRCDSATCVEVGVADRGKIVAVRDSKQTSGPILRFTADEWSSFVAGVREGDFDCK